MRVIARQIDMFDCPANVRSYLGQSFVTVGKEYTVYAIAMFEAILLVQIVDDLGYPNWRPVWLFDVADPKMPQDWICNIFQNDPRLVIGPEFVAGSQAEYSEMVELEPAQVDRFWEYVKGHDSPDD